MPRPRGTTPPSTPADALGLPHPRAYGTFPRVLGHYVRDKRVLTLPQAVHKMTGLAAERLGLPSEKVVINIERFGNTTAATIPLALNDAVCEGRLKRGDRVLLASVGAGFTVGAILMRWGC